jgi:hypothetical protein
MPVFAPIVGTWSEAAWFRESHDIIPSWRGESSFKDSLAEPVDFDLPDALVSRSFKGKVEPSDSGKEGKEAH